MNIFSDILHIFYPKLCVSCESSLFINENQICLQCVYKLPKTNFHTITNNPIEKLFWGKAKIENASSFYFFKKDSKVQKILHELKYKDNSDVGLVIGELYGIELVQEEKFRLIDAIIPVPLSPKKMKKRGYNQSESFAKGLLKTMKKELLINCLIRNQDSQTQTKKSRIERWENVDSIFAIKNHQSIENKHILLVDDVVTTGSTLEACAIELLKVKGVKVSIATIAIASM